MSFLETQFLFKNEQKRKGHHATSFAVPMLFTLLSSLLCSANSQAAIVATGGNAVQIAAPASVEPGVAPSPQIRAFNELQNEELPRDIQVDAFPVSNITDPAGLVVNGTINQGTCVSSHYIWYDPSLVLNNAQGSVVFNNQIIGVALIQASLDDTNPLGNPATIYPITAQCNFGAVDCGMELNPDTIHVDNFWVRVRFNALTPGDRVRVITRGWCGGGGGGGAQ